MLSLMNKKKILLLCGLYIAIAMLCAVFVNSHDDYFVPETGTSFLGSVQYALTMGNGRYLGNILGTYLSVRYIPNLIVRSVFLFALVVLTAAVCTDIDRCSLSMAAVLILFPGLGIYTQAYEWGHGFYNYTPPVVMLLTGMLLVRKSVPFKGRNICLAALGIIQSLFAENVTVVATFMAALMLVDAIYKKKEYRGAVIYLISSCVGTATMFIAPKLSGLGGSLGWYRGVAMPGNEMFLPRLVENIGQILLTVQGWQVMFVFMFALLLIRQHRVRRRGGWFVLGIMALSDIAMLYFAHFTTIYTNLSPSLLSLIISACFLVLSAFVLICLLFEKETLYEVLIPFLGAGVSIAELLFVQPIGARCLLVTYALLTVAVMRLWKIELTGKERITRICQRSAAAAAVFMYAVLLPMQATDFKAALKRDNSIREQVSEGKTEVVVSGLPYPDIVFKADIFDLYGYTFNCGDMDAMNFVIQDN